MGDNRDKRRQPMAEVSLPVEQAPDDPERTLDLACASVFSSGAGELVLNWLRSAWVHEILGPSSSDAELRYREGGRFVVGALMTRIERGKKPDGGNVRRG